MVKIYETEIKVDKNQQLLEWLKSLDENQMLPNQENYNKMFLGIWSKEKKEGNKMIESINLIDLYANEHKNSIENEFKEKETKLKEKCEVINKFNELTKQYEENVKELYLSQFTEEEKENFILHGRLNDDDEELKFNLERINHYYVNNNYKPDNYEEKIETPYREKKQELDSLIKTVKAHIGIAKTKEEVEEILTRYGIIDKKGKLVTK